MTRHCRQRLSPLLLAGALALGLSLTATAGAEELRIGFLAPTTGIFTADRHRHGQRLPDVSGRAQRHARRRQGHVHRRGRPGQAGRRRDQGQEADPAGQGATCWSAACWPRPPMRWRRCQPPRRRSTSARSATADDLAQRQVAKYPYFVSHDLGALAAEPSARAMGLRPGLQENASPSPPTMPSATSRSAASRRPSRTAAARSSRKSGRRSAPRTSGPISRPSRADADAIFTLMVGPMSLQFPKQLRASGNKKPIVGRRHQL